jgi:hypothetical protein
LTQLSETIQHYDGTIICVQIKTDNSNVFLLILPLFYSYDAKTQNKMWQTFR